MVADARVVRDHVAVEADELVGGVPPCEVGLAVAVDEDGGIDVAEFVEHQRLAERVLERPERTVAHRDADGHAAGLLLHGYVPIELPVALEAR